MNDGRNLIVRKCVHEGEANQLRTRARKRWGWGDKELEAQEPAREHAWGHRVGHAGLELGHSEDNSPEQ